MTIKQVFLAAVLLLLACLTARADFGAGSQYTGFGFLVNNTGTTINCEAPVSFADQFSRLVADDSSSEGILRYLNTVPSGGNRRLFTISFWVRMAVTPTSDRFAAEAYDDDTTTYDGVRLEDDGLVYFDFDTASEVFSQATVVSTTDITDNAWHHIVIQVDTAQGTDTNRTKIFVDGSDDTDTGSSTYPPQNADSYFNWDSSLAPLYLHGDNGNGDEFLVDDFAIISGTIYAPTSFTDDAGRPTDLSGLTWGTTGIWLQFECADSGGFDTSGNEINLYDGPDLDLADPEQFVDVPGTTFTYQASNSAASDTVTAPASIDAGDLLVVYNVAAGFSAPADAVPTGFTEITTQTSGFTRSTWSYKIADGTEDSSSITGMTEGLVQGMHIYQYRGGAAITSVTASTPEQEGTAGDPAQQTVAISEALQAPVLAFASWFNSNAVDPRTSSITKDHELYTTDTNLEMYSADFLFQTGLDVFDTGDFTVDMDDEGTSNTLISFYLTFEF